jgi:hypothetical protein
VVVYGLTNHAAIDDAAPLCDPIVGPGGKFACSYRTENLAIRAAARFLKLKVPNQAAGGAPLPRQSAALVTDSLSVISALALGPLNQRSRVEAETWHALAAASTHFDVKLCFVYAHSRTSRNDEADKRAKEAAEASQDGVLCWSVDAVRAAKPMILLETLMERERQNTFRFQGSPYTTDHNLALVAKLSRRTQVLGAQVRVGLCIQIGDIRHAGGALVPPPNCRWCGREGCETVPHVLHDCDALAELRAKHLPEMATRARWIPLLHRQPVQAMTFVTEALAMVTERLAYRGREPEGGCLPLGTPLTTQE